MGYDTFIMAISRLRIEDSALLVVDVQERLVPVMHDPASIVSQVGRLIDGINALDMPVLVTEQYRKGLGVTVPVLADRLSGAVCNHEKLAFSACIEPVLDELSQRGIRSVIVCGIEAHVCVLQTCLDLAKSGYIVAIAVDAISSRRKIDCDTAVSRMLQAQVLPTTVESALLELVGEAGTDQFKAVLPIIK
jgi:nicotinamidase-related amidase